MDYCCAWNYDCGKFTATFFLMLAELHIQFIKKKEGKAVWQSIESYVQTTITSA
jgi:hypothetical protein